MEFFLGVVYGGFAAAGLLAITRGLRLAADNRRHPIALPRNQEEAAAAARRKSLPVLMYVVAVPLLIFGIAGLSALAVGATR